MRHRLLALLSAAALACGPVLVLAPQARADTALIASDPADGATVTGPPSRVLLAFLDPPSGDSTFAVVSPSGKRVDDSVATEPQRAGGYTVTVGLKPLSEVGRYTVEYFTVALDGVPLSGTISFTYTGSGANSESRPPDPGSRLPLTALLGTPLLLLIATCVVIMLRRRASPTPADVPATPASCPECGASATPDQGFCVQCGARLH